jgi:hypothetical protein
MTRTIISATLLAASIAMLIVLGTPAHARARAGCSDASLQGNYGVQGTGAAVSGPLEGPVAFIGLLTFDGAGQLAGNLSVRLNSASGPTTQIKAPIVGRYTVNADCTGEDTWTNPVTGNFNTHQFVIVDNGQQVLFLVTTPNSPAIVSVVGRKQFHSDSDRD